MMFEIQNSDINQENSGKVSKKEKIILLVLAVVFLAVLLGAFWDIFGRKLLCNCGCDSKIINEQARGVQTATSTPNGGQRDPGGPGGPKDGVMNSASTVKQNKTNAVDASVSYTSYSQCIENTKDLPSSKDCCDCLSGDASVHKACRDMAATYDFSKNTVFKTFEIPTTLGQNGDYSACTATGSEQECKQCCENSGKYVCGDYRFCRTACAGLSQ